MNSEDAGIQSPVAQFSSEQLNYLGRWSWGGMLGPIYYLALNDKRDAIINYFFDIGFWINARKGRVQAWQDGHWDVSRFEEFQRRNRRLDVCAKIFYILVIAAPIIAFIVVIHLPYSWKLAIQNFLVAHYSR